MITAANWSWGRKSSSSPISRGRLRLQNLALRAGGVPFKDAWLLSDPYIEVKSLLLYSEAAVILWEPYAGSLCKPAVTVQTAMSP